MEMRAMTPDLVRQEKSLEKVKTYSTVCQEAICLLSEFIFAANVLYKGVFQALSK